MTDDQLLACPFCSSEAEIRYSAADETFPISLYGVHCRQCTCGHGASENKQEAIKAWNTRHQPIKPLFYPSEQMVSVNKILKDFTDTTLKYHEVLKELKELKNSYAKGYQAALDDLKKAIESAHSIEKVIPTYTKWIFAEIQELKEKADDR